MVHLGALSAVLLALLPVAVWLAVRSRRDRPLWEIALDLPMAIAIDLLGILALTVLLPLELAVLSSRPLWLAAAVVTLRARRKGWRIPWPRAVGPRELAMVAAAAAVAVLLSGWLSWSCHNYDRGWHIPLVASLRGQQLPFANVYQPGHVLTYHFAGDVWAAALQTLSFDVLHASHALSLAHDLAFGLVGATMALLLRWFGARSITAAGLVTLATLLAGPLTVLNDHAGRVHVGYNFINFYKLSFRPHVPLGALLLIGVVGALLARLRASPADEVPLHRTAGVLVACTALLAITDEASIGVLGLALGLTWLAVPEILHERRSRGLLVFVLLAVALVLPNLVFSAALSPAAESADVAWVPWRSPGYYRPPLPLSDPKGRSVLRLDVLPMAAVWLGGLAALLERPTRGRWGSVLLYTALLGISVLALTRVDLGARSIESHRFMTAVMVLFPLFAAFWLTSARRRARSSGLQAATGLAVSALLVGAMGLSAVSTLEWLRTRPDKDCVVPSKLLARDDFHRTNCRAEAGARLGELATPRYAPKSILYLVLGCRPSFAAGPQQLTVKADREPGSTKRVRRWALQTGRALVGLGALRELDRHVLMPDQTLAVHCPAHRGYAADAMCQFLSEQDGCRSAGRKVRDCTLAAAQRQLPVRQWARYARALRESEAERGATNPASGQP